MPQIKGMIGDWIIELDMDDYGALQPTISHASGEPVFLTDSPEDRQINWSRTFSTRTIERNLYEDSRNRRAAELARDHQR